MSAPITWARVPPQATRFCAVSSADDSVTRTYCRGSWPAGTEIESATDPRELACKACVAAMGETICQWCNTSDCTPEAQPWCCSPGCPGGECRNPRCCNSREFSFSIAAAAGPEKPVSCDSDNLTTETLSLVD